MPQHFLRPEHSGFIDMSMIQYHATSDLVKGCCRHLIKKKREQVIVYMPRYFQRLEHSLIRYSSQLYCNTTIRDKLDKKLPPLIISYTVP